MATVERRPRAARPRDPASGMYRTMVECRLFETRAQELFFEGLVRGTTHLGIGQEAVAAGFAAAMRDDDYTFCTYRGHNHTLARGVPMAPIFAELFGRATGLLGGKGGSMHLTSVEHGVMGSYAIVGAHLPIALGRGVVGAVPQVRPGRGLLLRRRDDEHRRVPRGAQHGRGLEGAGRVRVREQPVHGVHADRRGDRGRRGRRPTGRRAYGLEPIVVDGNDVEAVYAVATDGDRRGRGPARARRSIEALTYRHGGHSRADPGKYRPDDEVEAWKARDPIPALPRAARRGRRRRGRRSTRSTTEARRQVAAAEAEARAAPEPTAEVLETQVWADGGSRVAELTYRAGRSRPASPRRWSATRSVVLIGEDVGAAGGVFKLTEGLFDRFGPERVRDTPISEQAIVGAAMGAAMTGLRPDRRADVQRLLRRRPGTWSPTRSPRPAT